MHRLKNDQDPSTLNIVQVMEHLHSYAGERQQKGQLSLAVESGERACKTLQQLAYFLAEAYEVTYFTTPKPIQRNSIGSNIWVRMQNHNTGFECFLTAEKRHQKIILYIAMDITEKWWTSPELEAAMHAKITMDAHYCYYAQYIGERARIRSQLDLKQPAIQEKIEKILITYELSYMPEQFEALSSTEIIKQLKQAFNTLYKLGSFEGATRNVQKSSEKRKEEQAMYPKNLILYGPPGTGKTYHTVLYAVAIIEKTTVEQLEQQPYEQVLSRYQAYQDAAQIQFTTFHQSYGYEEFIEGIKPQVKEGQQSISYKVESGVFKQFCEDSKSVKVMADGQELAQHARIWKISLGGSGHNELKQYCFRESEIRIGWPKEVIDVAKEEGYMNNSLHYFFEEMAQGDIVFSLANNKHIDAIGIITSEAFRDETPGEEYPHVRYVKWVATDIYERIYELNGSVNLTLQTIYELTRISFSHVKELIDKYSTDNSTKVVRETDENYVFIIDEINRGNISKILGELITLIEPTKREGAREEIRIVLPYSKEMFSVPNNVYIIGTMNTADRSIALLDTALRRRFQFIELMPSPDVLANVCVGNINVGEMLRVINERIEVLYDREHMIGHAYFTPLIEEPTLAHLARIFEQQIMPLLQEYFYDDFEKIALILADDAKASHESFIQQVPIKNVFKTAFDVPRFTYIINRTAYRNEASYRGIYE
ncbi:AAA family ATPase [Caryophanon tenue]|uniref:ATPase dynein-related AAA domain-containing protein n=1 Tax=Caryophanon tenue TaxID=33978 RepID=A0A1C0Y608_9BACL|nr:AAA family ATPase [Caryophanon tenue]OCS82617.1 hypothetical protein A6M13_07010 [Caryophanon tenue]